MTGLEFVQLESSAEVEEVLRKIIISFLEQGFRAVPNATELSQAMEYIIRKNGWRDQDISDISWSAAKSLGMKKKE